MSEWQPIEKIPKSGKDILLLLKDKWAPLQLKTKDEIDIGCWNKDVWEFRRFSPQAFEIIGWQPLPESPKKEHYCAPSSKEWICKSDLNEPGLILSDYKGHWIKVIACPFCGEPAEKE